MMNKKLAEVTYANNLYHVSLIEQNCALPVEAGRTGREQGRVVGAETAGGHLERSEHMAHDKVLVLERCVLLGRDGAREQLQRLDHLPYQERRLVRGRVGTGSGGPRARGGQRRRRGGGGAGGGGGEGGRSFGRWLDIC